MIRSVIFAFALLFSTTASAQHAHKTGNTPTETGQATFAAIAEIVAVLSDDPGTDWSKVNINGLRSHLLDMDRVTMRADVDVTSNSQEVEFKVTGTGEVIGSIQRMVMAHSKMLAAGTGWTVQSNLIPDGAAINVKAENVDELAQVKGLGFFGLMTVGAHHQQHHLQISKGANPHH